VPLGRPAAVDFGLSRIGVAVADELGMLAHPRPVIPARPPARALRALGQLVKEEGIDLFLVGLPLHLDGSESLSSKRARKFAEELAQATGVTVELVDERLSTVEAQARLTEAGRSARTSKELIDSASAAVLLQAYLNGQRREGD
jgi:putative Holliday junction resolvase